MYQFPPPLTPLDAQGYSLALKQMDDSRLLKENEVMERVYGRLEPALPDNRLDLDDYPHPVVQRRLLALNEMYHRAVADPVSSFNQQQTKTMVEWGVAGGIVGGLVGAFTNRDMWMTTGIGAVLGAVAGRSTIIQQLLTEASSRLLMV